MSSRSEAFDLSDLRGAIATGRAGTGGASAARDEAIRRVIDAARATRTISWGRNYLFAAVWERDGPPRQVVVKQFRHQTRRARLRRWLKGSNAERSFAAAQALRAAGLETPAPVLWAESKSIRGPAFYVCDLVPPEAFELRFFLRARNAGREAEEFPQVDARRLLEALGRQAAAMHRANIWHRDWTSGNVFVEWRGELPPRLWLLDLNRARLGRALTRSERARELCRMPVLRPEDQSTLLAAYHGGPSPALDHRLYRLYHRGFLTKNALKNVARGAGGSRRMTPRGGGFWRRRTAHAHIPAVARGAASRERMVWDSLSDQPHQHAGRARKLAVRLADLPHHVVDLGRVIRLLPAWRREYAAAGRRRSVAPPWVRWPGLSVGVRPWPDDPEGLLRALDELGTRRVSLRLHPWADRSAAEAESQLAGELERRGFDLAITVPQNRDLVRDPGRWRGSLREIAGRFTAPGRVFQIGQAINRSKWGIWVLPEYQRLFAIAQEVLQGECPEVALAGPAVIDFEFQIAAAALGRLDRAGLAVDVLSALLYVDRRGAPEARQLGLDLPDKVLLLEALGRSAPGVRRPVDGGGPRVWLSEMNWPLREGPHSPAGQAVAVDETRQADYLVRYALLAYATGAVERIDWWQLLAAGYGLVDPRDGELRRRPAFAAMARLESSLRGARLRQRPAPRGVRDLEIELADGTPGRLLWRCDGVVGPSGIPVDQVVETIPLVPGGAPRTDAAMIDGSPRLLILRREGDAAGRGPTDRSS